MLRKDIIGLRFPVQLDGKGDLASLTGKKLEDADNKFLISIERGEIPWDGNKGTRLRELLHSKVANALVVQAIAFREATDVINTYNPRFRVVSTIPSFEDNLISISVQYVERAKVDPERRAVSIEVNR
ncbi:MAG: hypothetical protein GY841_15440 [FCB group bacterium]|nr:hypothetical protein [FCB group bacterium]